MLRCDNCMPFCKKVKFLFFLPTRRRSKYNIFLNINDVCMPPNAKLSFLYKNQRIIPFNTQIADFVCH